MTIWYVYALCEPTTGAVRYVGKSSNPARRLASHRSKSGAPRVREWLLELDRDPELRVLGEYADDTTALAAEQYQVRAHRAAGCNILNDALFCGRSGGKKRAIFSGLGERTLRRRRELGKTQNTLAAEAGVERGELSRIENGHRPNPSAAFAVLIARALDVSVDWLVTGEERAQKASAA